MVILCTDTLSIPENSPSVLFYPLVTAKVTKKRGDAPDILAFIPTYFSFRMKMALSVSPKEKIG